MARPIVPVAAPAPVVAPSMENVEYVRPEVVNLTPRYSLLRDVLDQNVKDQGELYLPCPSGKPFQERDHGEITRYADYKGRAIFYNFTGRALSGFIGQIFSREYEKKVPTSLDWLIKDVSGDGQDIEQFAKECCAEALSMGRYGVLVDYPKFNGAPSKADVDNGIARPVFVGYRTENIINWRTKKRGAKNVLSLLVLRESYISSDDEFEAQFDCQYRVLDLINDQYRVRLWRPGVGYIASEEVMPRANGKYLDEIPFAFIGSVNNDAIPDNPPMYDMANVNIGHYRNSADYEESVFLCGQPTYVISGITDKWYKNILNGVIRFGSRFGLPLEKEAKAEILQAEPNTLVKEAMKDKENQMAALGADFLKEQNVRRTATEAAIDDNSRTSTISNISKNVSSALRFCLEWAALFQGDSENNIDFKLNSEFDLTRLDAAERAQIIKEYQADLISWTEARSALHKAGIATLDDDKALKEIETKAAAQIEQMAKEFQINNPIDNPNDNKE